MAMGPFLKFASYVSKHREDSKYMLTMAFFIRLGLWRGIMRPPWIWVLRCMIGGSWLRYSPFRHLIPKQGLMDVNYQKKTRECSSSNRAWQSPTPTKRQCRAVKLSGPAARKTRWLASDVQSQLNQSTRNSRKKMIRLCCTRRCQTAFSAVRFSRIPKAMESGNWETGELPMTCTLLQPKSIMHCTSPQDKSMLYFLLRLIFLT